MTSKTTKPKPNARHNDWRPKFLEALADIPNIAHACRKAGVSRDCAYRHINEDKKFAAEIESAMRHGIDTLEAVYMDHSKNGTEEPVYMKDEHGKIVKVHTLRKYPYAVGMRLLQAHKPDKYAPPKNVIDLAASSTDMAGNKTEFVIHVSGEELP